MKSVNNVTMSTIVDRLLEKDLKDSLTILQYSIHYNNSTLIKMCYQKICQSKNSELEKEMISLLIQMVSHERNSNFLLYSQKLLLYDSFLNVKYMLMILNELLFKEINILFSYSNKHFEGYQYDSKTSTEHNEEPSIPFLEVHTFLETISQDQFKFIKYPIKLKPDEINRALSQDKDLTCDTYNTISIHLFNSFPINSPSIPPFQTPSSFDEQVFACFLTQYLSLLNNNEHMYRQYIHCSKRKDFNLTSKIDSPFPSHKFEYMDMKKDKKLIELLLSSITKQILFFLYRSIHLKHQYNQVLESYLNYVRNIISLYMDNDYMSYFNRFPININYYECYYQPTFMDIQSFYIMVSILLYLYSSFPFDVFYAYLCYIERALVENELFIRLYYSSNHNDLQLNYIYDILFQYTINLNYFACSEEVYMSAYNQKYNHDNRIIQKLIIDTLKPFYAPIIRKILFIFLDLKKSNKNSTSNKKSRITAKLLKLLAVLVTINPSVLLSAIWSYPAVCLNDRSYVIVSTSDPVFPFVVTWFIRFVLKVLLLVLLSVPHQYVHLVLLSSSIHLFDSNESIWPSYLHLCRDNGMNLLLCSEGYRLISSTQYKTNCVFILLVCPL